MSEACKTLLDRLGKYQFEERGQVEVKVRNNLKIFVHVQMLKLVCLKVGYHGKLQFHQISTAIDEKCTKDP